MKPQELKYDDGGASEPFKLADGHNYFLHRIEREGKPAVYSLVGSDTGAAFTPYITDHQMEKVISLRLSPERAVDIDQDDKSRTGFKCPGCGAVVTETGVHVGPPAEAATEPCPECDGTGKKLNGQCPECKGTGKVTPARKAELDAALHPADRPKPARKSRFLR